MRFSKDSASGLKGRSCLSALLPLEWVTIAACFSFTVNSSFLHTLFSAELWWGETALLPGGKTGIVEYYLVNLNHLRYLFYYYFLLTYYLLKYS